MTPLRFPRASRDSCLRAADPMQGPYRRDITLMGHRFVVRFAFVGVVVLVVLLATGVMK